MEIDRIDHINIVTDKLDATAAFYELVLALRSGPVPEVAGIVGRWLYDKQARPIVHLGLCDASQPLGPAGQFPTGALDHVAFAASGFEEALTTLGRASIEFRVNDREIGGLRQIFVKDPNGIQIELNFHNE